MTEASQSEGKGKSLSCPTCNSTMRDEKVTQTFYDTIKIDMLQQVCEKGHMTETEEECDRVAMELRKKELHIITSYVARLIVFCIVGALIFLFSSGAAFYSLSSYAPKSIAYHAVFLSLGTGAVLATLFIIYGMTHFFKTFIKYWNAKEKEKNKIKTDVDPEDPLGALDEA
jgi:hypothetical protein